MYMILPRVNEWQERVCQGDNGAAIFADDLVEKRYRFIVHGC